MILWIVLFHSILRLQFFSHLRQNMPGREKQREPDLHHRFEEESGRIFDEAA